MKDDETFEIIVQSRNHGKIYAYRELLEKRIKLNYMNVDGSYSFPDSQEGELLKITHEMLELQRAGEQKNTK